MTESELLKVLRHRTNSKLFSGKPVLHECGERYERASANTSGVGMACFNSGDEQRRMFEKAFSEEAIAARPYIYTLECALIEALSK